jgi:hypothetical protein
MHTVKWRLSLKTGIILARIRFYDLEAGLWKTQIPMTSTG